MENINNTLTKIITLILSIIFLTNVAYTNAQSTERYYKNTAYASYGNIIFASQISLSYERMIFEKNKWRTNAKVNYGNYLTNNFDFDDGAIVRQNYLSLSGVQLIGLLEVNAGVALSNYKLARVMDQETKQRFEFYGNIGIRYWKNKFVFRAGFGNLELLYVGMGLNF